MSVYRHWDKVNFKAKGTNWSNEFLGQLPYGCNAVFLVVRIFTHFIIRNYHFGYAHRTTTLQAIFLSVSMKIIFMSILTYTYINHFKDIDSIIRTNEHFTNKRLTMSYRQKWSKSLLLDPFTVHCWLFVQCTNC